MNPLRNQLRLRVTLLGLLVLLIAVPYLRVPVDPFFSGYLNGPGTLRILAVMFVIGALAATYDLLLGYTGLFSLGHGLFFAVGGYAFAMSMKLTDLGMGASILIAITATIVTAVVINSVSLRASDIAYALVTLAFAQVASILVSRNYFRTGGEEGITLPYAKMPSVFVGVANTAYTYWLALGLLVAVTTMLWCFTRTRLGSVMKAIRENELRVAVLGMSVYWFKWISATVGAILAGLCGICYVIVIGTAEPSVTSLMFSIGLVVMVTLGGKGRIWGAVAGGLLFTYLEQRLPVWATADAITGLPDAFSLPLSEPQLLLGVVFLVVLFVLPGGLATLGFRRRAASSQEPTPIASGQKESGDNDPEISQQVGRKESK